MLRPVFELLCGRFSVRERLIRALPVTSWGAFLRDELAETYRQAFPEARVNDAKWLAEEPTLLVNGRWLADRQALRAMRADAAGLVEDQVAWIAVEPFEAALFADGPMEEAASRLAMARPRVPAGGRLLARPWDLVEQNSRQIASDFEICGTGPLPPGLPWQVAIVGPQEAVWVHPSARLEPFVTLDATKGPISIDAGVTVQSFSRIEGPCHVATQCVILGAKIRGGTTVGPVSRVGGEIEASIIHGHVNKYHDGFLGHSYIGAWVNLGALSTNSDLKTDYSSVRVSLGAQSIDTQMVKVGCFIGDHTKTGLGSLFNTGSSIGVMCIILPAGGLLPKEIPSFTTVWHGALSDAIPLERALKAARAAMARRNVELTAADERLLRHAHRQTAQQREKAILAQPAGRQERPARPA